MVHRARRPEMVPRRRDRPHRAQHARSARPRLSERDARARQAAHHLALDRRCRRNAENICRVGADGGDCCVSSGRKARECRGEPAEREVGMAKICKVLVVEDHEGIRAVLGDALKTEGYDFTLVDSAGDVRGALDSGDHDVVVIDLPLAEGDAFALAEAAQADGVGVILTTGDQRLFPEADAASAGLLALRARPLPHHHPGVFRRAGDQLANAATAETWDVAQPVLHPLDLAGRLVQEDLCLLLAEGGPYRLVAASLCSPARWRLADKIGRPLGAIHDPVPGYGAKLAAPVERFFALLKPGKLVWRLNWGIVDDPAPFQPGAREAAAPVTPVHPGGRPWLRAERPTLQRLPATGAVVFTIRTHITGLAAAIRSRTSALELAAALRDMPADTRRYKHIAPIAPALLAWLDARAEYGG